MSLGAGRDGPRDDSTRNGHLPSGGARFVFLLTIALSTSSASADEAFDAVTAVRNAGAPELALTLIDQEQPKSQPCSDEWSHWERERISLLESLKAWEGLEQRTARLPEGCPLPFVIWMKGERARALLEVGRPTEARELLSQLIWSLDEQSPAMVAGWRRLIIRAYLAEGLTDDALTALLRYGQDLDARDEEERLLAARTLLKAGRSGDAIQLLANGGQPLGRALLLLARLREGNITPLAAMAAGKKQKGERGLTPEVRLLLTATVAEASAKAGEYPIEAMALEEIFAAQGSVNAPSDLFSYSGDTLWESYLNFALMAGKREKLPEGNDGVWMAHAESVQRAFPVRARSVYALVAQRSTDEQIQVEAHQRLQQMVGKLPGGKAILRTLYLQSEQFAGERLPTAIRTALLDTAIAEGDTESALRLVREARPVGGDPWEERVRHAKLLLLAGSHDEGERAARQLVDEADNLTGEQLDRLMQLLFDLQTIGDHDAAVTLFERLMGVSPPSVQREILYWMGDSRAAQERPLEAARLYLRSATLLQPNSTDLWAQTARYQAAKSLVKAGLVADAVTQYQMILQSTDDPARRAVLRRDLEQLWQRKR